MPPGPDSGIPSAPPGIDLFLFIAYCERTISGPGRFQAQIPGFGYSFNWPLLSFHDLRRILSVGLSFPSTICVVFFQLGTRFLPQFAAYSFNWFSFPSMICIVFFQLGSPFLPRFASCSFKWALISLHDLRRILSIGLSFPSTICAVPFGSTVVSGRSGEDDHRVF